jgi:hypothetical protein
LPVKGRVPSPDFLPSLPPSSLFLRHEKRDKEKRRETKRREEKTKKDT